MIYRSWSRMGGFFFVVLLAIAAIVARLTFVQLVDGKVYAAAARANQVRLIPVAAPRGLVLDRHGNILVRSRPSFTVALIPSQVKDIKMTIASLASTLQIPADQLWHRLYHHHDVNYENFAQVQLYEPYGPVILASDLKTWQMARLAETQPDLPGVDLEEQPVRNYPFGKMAANVFGYVGQISEDEYQKRKAEGEHYTPNDVIGKDGIEATYDSYLKGTPGGQQVMVNAWGAVVADERFVKSKPGDVVVTTIDLRLQRIAQRALADGLKAWAKTRGVKRLSGALVILDPWTGGVLAMASLPTFNPNDFATPISPNEYAHYVLDPLRPLYNRAIGAATPTGSTFKMVTGSAAISSGVIKPHQVLYDSGAWDCHGVHFVDLAAGGIGNAEFTLALAASSDGYFYQLGDRLGHARLRYYALQFGLGADSGIDLPGEYPGNWPTNEWTMKVYGVPLEPSDVCQLAIGQGAMQATPLQMANVAAAVVNGGTLYRPHVVQEIRTPTGKVVKDFSPDVIRQVPVTQEALKEVRTGMAHVTNAYGTGYGLAIPGLPYGGKTGTVQTDGGNGPNTTWFVCFAPANHPQLTMAIFVERSGGYGASVAGPIAQKILAEYFHKKI
ncbi:MAG: penicillin-binding protein 2 [Candidatus Eremiobacteraeota bacterium]|nr:penicillin-binding protein 2 [Candidatus Eremiobacteraeota bacterium]